MSRYSKKTRKKNYFFFFLVCLFIINLGVNIARKGYADEEGGYRTPAFSLEFKDESITACLERLSLVSGYDIHISGDYTDFTVSMKLKDVTLEKALERILKGIDHALKWNKETRKVSLFLYNGPKMNNQRVTLPDFTPSFPVMPPPQEKPDEIQENLETDSSDDRDLTEPDSGTPDDSRENRVRDKLWKRTDLPLSGSDTDFIQGTRTGDMSDENTE